MLIASMFQSILPVCSMVPSSAGNFKMKLVVEGVAVYVSLTT